MKNTSVEEKYLKDIMHWVKESREEGELYIGGFEPVKPLYTFIHQHDKNG